jgi:prephenate dehydratase
MTNEENMNIQQKIGIQGGQASYHEQVALLLYSDDEVIYYETFSALFAALQSGEVDNIVCAVSNTHIGPIADSAAELAALQGRYTVLHEVPWPVHHALLGLPGTTLEAVQVVRSQIPALDQCRQFLASTLPNVQIVEDTDTALSAKYVATTGDRSQVAIASEAAGRLYGIRTIIANIQDDPDNITNFIAITLKET